MKTIFAAALLVVGAAGFNAANAMPLAPLSAADTASVIHVAQGCGPGMARGPMGACRRVAGWGRPGPVVRRCRYWGPGRRVCRTWW